MSTIKMPCSCCKRELFLPDEMAVLECSACGTLNSRPQAEGAALVDFLRATQQRQACDFTNAEVSYQQVLRDYPKEHEALWGLVLCRYGVEYVETADSSKHTPICRFVDQKPVSEDGDFLLACKYAPEDVRAQYIEDAAYLDNILAEVRKVTESCKAYDIFLCYKSSIPGSDGARARDLYHHLGQMGYQVFFAHDTLKKSDSAHDEAMIYHALSTAKVMLVICSHKDYLHSPRILSEWTRYLERVDTDASLHLVPLLYDDMTPNHLPKAFVTRHLEGLMMREPDALDNLHAMLEHYIPRTVSETDLLMLRVQLALEEGRWDAADDAATLLKNLQPNRAAGYMGQLLASLHCSTEAQLACCTEPFETQLAWERTLKFATAEERKVFEGYLAASQLLRQQQQDDVHLRESLAAQQLTADFSDDGAIVCTGCSDPSVTELTLPQGVTALANDAFAGLTSLVRVTLPGSLTAIGSGAFAGCTSLADIRIPSGVNAIGAEAFMRCYSLRSVEIPSGVTVIEPGTFCDCASMTSVVFPPALTAIGARAFMECSQLRMLDLPASLESLGESAFEGCFGLLGLVLPNGVTAIPARAFKRCSGLREADLPRTLQSIGSEAFAMCISMHEVSLPVQTVAAPDAFSTCLQLRKHYKL